MSAFDKLIGRLADAANDASREEQADHRYWEENGMERGGQDSQEAEESGRLIGVREGLERALTLAREIANEEERR